MVLRLPYRTPVGLLSLYNLCMGKTKNWGNFVASKMAVR